MNAAEPRGLDESATQKVPAVSVVMPSRNVERFIDEAISSILVQTFTDFEFIICDDSSSDGTREKITQWAARDSRIRAYFSDTYLGPAEAANWTVSLAKAPMILRMDADDISDRTRIAKQYRVMMERPDIVLLGCLFEGIDSNSRKIYGRDRSTLLRTTFATPCGHATAIFRTEALREIGGYRKVSDFWEDFDMIYRMAAIGKVCIGTEPLFQYRHSRGHARVSAKQLRIEHALDLRYRCGLQFAKTAEYESVLSEAETTNPDRVAPHVFYSLATLHTLAGNRPRLLGRFVKRAHLLPVFQSMGVLGRIMLAQLAPKLIRSIQSRRKAMRDRRAGKQIASETIVEWYWSKNHPEKQASPRPARIGAAKSPHSATTEPHQKKPAHSSHP